MSNDQRCYGTVREFNAASGIGYIELDENGDAVLVRYSSILGEGIRKLHVGQRVSFELEEGKRGLSAARVLADE